jgi:DNA polymerase-3 subunit gamma/tau
VVHDEPAPEPAPAAATPAPGTGTSTGLGLVDVRRLWPDLLDAVKLKRRYTWILLSQNAQVAAVDDKTLTIALVNAGARNSFSSGGSEEILRQAAIDVIGHDWRIEAIVDPSAQPGAESPIVVTRPAVAEQPADDGAPSRPAAPEPAPASQAPAKRPVDPESMAAARGAIQDTRPKGESRQRGSEVSDADADRDDPDADDHSLGGAQLLERELGASIIEEIKHD